MGWRRLRAVLGEAHGLDRHEVLHEQIALVQPREGAHAVLDAQLDALHQLVHVDLEEKRNVNS